MFNQYIPDTALHRRTDINSTMSLNC